jgi:hypothetical protein
MTRDVSEVMALPITQELLRDESLMRLSYSALDGSPRVIPVGYVWDGENVVFWTIPISEKIPALAADPRVAISVDILGPPPRALLLRGTAALATVDGVPQGYLDASHRTMPPEAWDGFDEQVRWLYDQMVVVTITITWAKLLDFETTAPSAVEQLVKQRSG